MSLIVIGCVCAVGIVAVVAMFLMSRSQDRQAVSESNATLQYCLRQAVNASVCDGVDQISRIQAEEHFGEPIRKVSDQTVNVRRPDPLGYYPEDPVGGDV